VSESMHPDETAGSHLRVAEENLDEAEALIGRDEGAPVEIVNADGNGDVVLISEHAGKLIPRTLDGLGVDPEVRSSHVAWDPGAEPVARHMAALLDAPLVLQRFSRLVYDCNRPPDAESAIPARSELFDIPGNAALSDAERRLRTNALYRPFRKHVAALLDRRTQQGKSSAVVTIHSFTPVYFGKPREVELGLLHDADSALADAMLVAASGWQDLVVRRNQPYGPEDGVTHTLQVDAVARGLLNVMIEIRNDLIETPDQQAAMAARLADLVGISLMRLPMNQGLRDYGTAG